MPTDTQSSHLPDIHNVHSAMDNYELEFLIEGDETTISTTVPRTAKVQQLRRLIYQEGEFDGFRIRDLKLLKVCHDHSPK
jgi:hypothetical protein